MGRVVRAGLSLRPCRINTVAYLRKLEIETELYSALHRHTVIRSRKNHYESRKSKSGLAKSSSLRELGFDPAIHNMLIHTGKTIEISIPRFSFGSAYLRMEGSHGFEGWQTRE